MAAQLLYCCRWSGEKFLSETPVNAKNLYNTKNGENTNTFSRVSVSGTRGRGAWRVRALPRARAACGPWSGSAGTRGQTRITRWGQWARAEKAATMAFSFSRGAFHVLIL